MVFGVNEPELLRIMTQTFREGDPSYAGALAGVQLGLLCFHSLELKSEIPNAVWEEHMALEELQIEEKNLEAMREGRGE